MEIMELAKEIGLQIKEDARITAMQKAREAYEQNKALQGAILEYNTQQTAMTEEYKKETPDQEFVQAINHRIQVLYDEIVGNPSMVAYSEAQNAVNSFMNEVNSEITFWITGERPCAHDCSSCHSDCGHSHE